MLRSHASHAVAAGGWAAAGGMHALCPQLCSHARAFRCPPTAQPPLSPPPPGPPCRSRGAAAGLHPPLLRPLPAPAPVGGLPRAGADHQGVHARGAAGWGPVFLQYRLGGGGCGRCWCGLLWWRGLRHCGEGTGGWLHSGERRRAAVQRCRVRGWLVRWRLNRRPKPPTPTLSRPPLSLSPLKQVCEIDPKWLVEMAPRFFKAADPHKLSRWVWCGWKRHLGALLGDNSATSLPPPPPWPTASLLSHPLFPPAGASGTSASSRCTTASTVGLPVLRALAFCCAVRLLGCCGVVVW